MVRMNVHQYSIILVQICKIGGYILTVTCGLFDIAVDHGIPNTDDFGCNPAVSSHKVSMSAQQIASTTNAS